MRHVRLSGRIQHVRAGRRTRVPAAAICCPDVQRRTERITSVVGFIFINVRQARGVVLLVTGWRLLESSCVVHYEKFIDIIYNLYGMPCRII